MLHLAPAHFGAAHFRQAHLHQGAAVAAPSYKGGRYYLEEEEYPLLPNPVRGRARVSLKRPIPRGEGFVGAGGRGLAFVDFAAQGGGVQSVAGHGASEIVSARAFGGADHQWMRDDELIALALFEWE